MARALARDNEVHGLARLAKPRDRERLAAAGVRPLAVDLAQGSLDALPDDFDCVLHFAVVKGGDADFDRDLTANAEGTGTPDGALPAREGVRPLLVGGGLPAARIAARARAGSARRQPSRADARPTACARSRARRWRASPRASTGCRRRSRGSRFRTETAAAGRGSTSRCCAPDRPIPVHPERPNLFNPIHEDDLVAHVPKLVAAASVPALIVNWGGSETVALEAWCAWLGELTGLEPRWHETPDTIASLPVDLTRMHALLGPTRVAWRDGLRRMLEARAPELLRR